MFKKTITIAVICCVMIFCALPVSAADYWKEFTVPFSQFYDDMSLTNSDMVGFLESELYDDIFEISPSHFRYNSNDEIIGLRYKLPPKGELGFKYVTHCYFDTWYDFGGYTLAPGDTFNVDIYTAIGIDPNVAEGLTGVRFGFKVKSANGTKSVEFPISRLHDGSTMGNWHCYFDIKYEAVSDCTIMQPYIVVDFYYIGLSSGGLDITYPEGITIAYGNRSEQENIESEGNSAADELAGAIPNHSSGFIQGMKDLVSGLSYNGTNCTWTFPQLYIPAMAGVSDQKIPITSSEMKIDISGWVQKLPEDILSLIQIILTIALLIYCVKELYGTIQYVLTLKGGGSSE